MTDSNNRRRAIALAEQDVERQRAGFRHHTLETHQRIDAARQRVRGWKVPLILVGGTLLGLLIGRPGHPKREPALQAEQAHHGTATHAAKAAGKAAGLMTGLSLATRVLPVVLSLARSVAPLIRR